MSHFRLLTILILGSALSPMAISQETGPELSKEPLSAEQVQVYRALLKFLAQGADASLNIANQTEAFDLVESDDDLKSNSGCLKGIELENLKQVASTVHRLDARILMGKKMVLVDPEAQAVLVRKNDPSKTIKEGRKVDDAVDEASRTGLFTLSEVAFDKQHQWAVLSFSFFCGRLCGSGAVVVLKKTGRSRRWKVTSRECVEWVS